jgi:MFS family permease
MAPYYTVFFFWSTGVGMGHLARPLYAAELGATPFLLVLITATGNISRLVSSATTGHLTDRLGRKPLVLLGNSIRGTTLVLQFFSETYWQFFALEFIGGIGVAMFNTSSQVVMADFTTAENRGRLMALRGMTNRAGSILGPALGGAAIALASVDLKYLFLLNASTKVIIHFLVFFLAKETAPEVNRRGRAAADGPQTKLDFSFFMTRAFLALMITTFTLNMMGQGGVFGALFPVQAREEVGLSPSTIGQVMSIASFIGLIAAYPNGWAVDRFGRKPTLIPGLLMLAGAVVLLSQMQGIADVYVLICLYGLGQALASDSSQAFAVDLAPPDRRGAFLGTWTLVGGAGSIFAPLFVGALASSLGYTPGYLVVAGMLVFSAAFMVVFGPETKAQRARQAAAAAAGGGGG